MNKNLFISIYLDKRRAKGNGKYPVKLRAFTKSPRIQKLYPTIFEFSEKEFESIWETQKPRNEYKELRLQLQAIENRANDTAKVITPFNFELFEKKLYRNVGEKDNVYNHYDNIIQKLKANNQLGSASSYELSMKSIKASILHAKGKESQYLSFYEVTPEWLSKYESYMIQFKNLSRTTVGIYLRNLRAVFNQAIHEKEIAPDIYPFGRKKYQIPAVRNVKKSLNKEQLKKLYEAKPLTPEQEKAKAFWFLSYSCNGMNIKDIALLKYENLKDNILVFYRAKTINTAKGNLKQITVYLNDFINNVIKKYGNPNRSPKQFIFSIISENDSEKAKHDKIKNFTRFINQNLKKLAKAEGLPENISTYYARHSFATNAIRNGASMEFVSEALSHSNLKTTQGYFAGFEEEDKRELMQKLMNFS
jgi:integrase/recombinase XerD